MIKVVGIDPGLAATGYAVAEALNKGGNLCDWGSIRTLSKSPLPLRLQEIYESVDAIIKKWNPLLLVIEEHQLQVH